jgi:hypothetical protein
MQLTTAAAAAELPRDWRENHLNFSHYSSANPTTKVRNQLRPTHRDAILLPIHRRLTGNHPISKDRRRAAWIHGKIWVQVAVRNWSEWIEGWWWARQNRSLGNIRRCHLYDAACTRVTTCTCTAVHSRLTWSFYFILFYFILKIFILFYFILKSFFKKKFLIWWGFFFFFFFLGRAVFWCNLAISSL